MLIEQSVLGKELLVTNLEETKNILKHFLPLSPPFSFPLPHSLYFSCFPSLSFFISLLSTFSPFFAFLLLFFLNMTCLRKHDWCLYIRICPLDMVQCRLETTQPLLGKEIVDRLSSTLVGFSRGQITYWVRE